MPESFPELEEVLEFLMSDEAQDERDRQQSRLRAIYNLAINEKIFWESIG